MIKNIIIFIVYMISFLISALVVLPCEIMSAVTSYEKDYHYKFHMWWFDKVLKKYD